MALDTFSLWDMAIPLNDIEMALLTGHPSFNILAVIKIPTVNFNVSPRSKMAGSATTHGTRDAFLFPFGTGLVIVADEAVCLVNGKVLPLDNLGMAGGASQLHSPSQLVQVFTMGEGDILIDHVSPEILDLMASLLQAACIADLRMRHGRLFPRDEIGQRDLSVDPLPL